MKTNANTLTFKVEVDFDPQTALKDKTHEELRVVVQNKMIEKLKRETAEPLSVRVSFVK